MEFLDLVDDVIYIILENDVFINDIVALSETCKRFNHFCHKLCYEEMITKEKKIPPSCTNYMKLNYMSIYDLDHAMSRGNIDNLYIDYMIANGLNVISNNKFISVACMYGRIDVVKHVISLGYDIKNNADDLFHNKCAYGGNVDLMKLLIEYGVIVNVYHHMMFIDCINGWCDGSTDNDYSAMFDYLVSLKISLVTVIGDCFYNTCKHRNNKNRIVIVDKLLHVTCSKHIDITFGIYLYVKKYFHTHYDFIKHILKNYNELMTSDNRWYNFTLDEFESRYCIPMIKEMIKYDKGVQDDGYRYLFGRGHYRGMLYYKKKYEQH